MLRLESTGNFQVSCFSAFVSSSVLSGVVLCVCTSLSDLSLSLAADFAFRFHSIHENQFHEAELLVNPEVLKTVRDGDLMGLWNTVTPGKTPETNHVPTERMVVLKVSHVFGTRIRCLE